MTEDEYSWMVGEILSLPREVQKTPKDCLITKFNYNNTFMDIAGKCVLCDEENEWNHVKFFITESLTCNACGRRHTAPIPDLLISEVKQGLEHLLYEYKTVAFWGINSYFYAFSGKMNLHYKRLYYIDSSDVRKGVDVFGYKIESKDIITKLPVNCVVVSVVQYYESLKKQIADEFPDLNRILCISELLQSSGNC